jgi:hypothetical protein
MRRDAKKNVYQADAATRETPLRLDEVEALGLSSSVRSPEQIAHLLSRVGATIKEQRRRMAELQRDVETMALRKAQDDHPMSRALAAIAELSEDELRQLLDVRYLSAMEDLVKERANLERARTLMVSESNRARFALARLLEDPDLGDGVRQRVEATLAQLPR